MEMKKETIEVTKAEVAVHWKEEELIPPSAEFVTQANMVDPGVFKRFSEENFPECFKEYADMLTWDKPWETIFDGSNPPFWRWFIGGKLNACYNCVDRHLPKYKNKVAFIFVPELEEEPHQVITYQELYKRVNEFAALLQDFCGLEVGDRVTIHMPMVPELPISMLACARIGVIHSVLFSGFSGKACADQAKDSKSRILITMDGYYRKGDLLDHKGKDEESAQLNILEKILVWQRYPGKYISKAPMLEDRNFFVNDLLKDYARKTVPPVSMSAEAPLFLMYTSGTTAKPKGTQHSTGGYLSYVAGTSKYIQDIHPEDTYWCMADIGWITGHSYIVYGPLAIGATSVIYEGLPIYPDAGRPWRIAEQLGVDIFHTAPTAIRMLRKAGPDEPKKYNYCFKHMTTVGEPIEPEVWRWYYEVVGKGKAVIVDTYWQTETGGFIVSTVPALQEMKPGSAGPGMLGIYSIILDDDKKEIKAGEGKAGNICIRNPWPGLMQTIWKEPERFIQTYYERYSKKDSKDWRDWLYFCGDASVQSQDGYYRLLGRMDDVINVAGHRLGTKELESAALLCEEVAEAAVIPVADEIKGKVPELYVSLKPGYELCRELEEKVKRVMAVELGPICKPKNVYIVPDMPKTRSGKIMRRVLAAISNAQDCGDTTTLANPEVVEEIQKIVQERHQS